MITTIVWKFYLNKRNNSNWSAQTFCKKAFEITSDYDNAIYSYFNNEENFGVRFSPKVAMRYGENPHQQAAFYGKLTDVFDKLHGKEISYNNLVDIESCIYLMEEFEEVKNAV